MNIEKLIEANKEIAKLKAKLVSQQLAHDDEITNIEICNESTARLIAQERDELKAMVNNLQVASCTLRDNHVGTAGGNCIVSSKSMGELVYALDKTPEQCLTAIKQQAIRDAISNSEQVELAGQGYVGTYVSLEDLEANILQLGEE